MGRSGGRGVCLGSVAAQELSGRPAFREAPFHYGPRSVCGRRAAHRAEQVGRVRRGHDAPYRRVARSPHRSAGGPNRCRLFAGVDDAGCPSRELRRVASWLRAIGDFLLNGWPLKMP